MKKIRLHQFLSKTGVFSTKRELLRALRDGELALNGRVTRDPHFQFDPDKKTVTMNGRKLVSLSGKLNLVMNKPEGYICSRLTARDHSLGKRSVFDIVKSMTHLDAQTLRTLFCVGRLDEQSSGLLIMTNDGALSTVLTHPRNRVAKIYTATLRKPLTPEQRHRLEGGVAIMLEENGIVQKYVTQPCTVEHGRDPCHILLRLYEGKKREVRRMIAAVGNEVVSLRRVALGNLSLDDLKLAERDVVLVPFALIQERILSAQK